MKIRAGFVSNSSSSSFCMYSVWVSKKQLREVLNIKEPSFDDTKSDHGIEIEEEKIKEELSKLGLDSCGDYESDYMHIGRNIDGQKLTQEFMDELERVRNTLYEIVGEDAEFIGGEVSN